MPKLARRFTFVGRYEHFAVDAAQLLASVGLSAGGGGASGAARSARAAPPAAPLSAGALEQTCCAITRAMWMDVWLRRFARRFAAADVEKELNSARAAPPWYETCCAAEQPLRYAGV